MIKEYIRVQLNIDPEWQCINIREPIKVIPLK